MAWATTVGRLLPHVLRSGAACGLLALAGSGGFASCNTATHHLDPAAASRGAATVRRSGDAATSPIVVVLTGGPCGGKSSALRKLQEHFSKLGFNVYAAPEVPTIVMNGGGKYPGRDAGEELVRFESAVLQLQLQMEDSFKLVARGPSIIVLDRAALDLAAYIPREAFLAVLAKHGVTEEELLGRYDLVLHLVTAADGAEAFYTTANNTARTETPEAARRLDGLVKQAYRGHSCHVVVGNESDFKHKLETAVKAIESFVRDRRA